MEIRRLSGFRGLDDAARQTSQDFSAPLDLGVTEWKSNRLQYFTDPHKTAQHLQADAKLVRETCPCSKDIIAGSRSILNRLNDPYPVKLVDVTELRLDSDFRRDLKVQ